MQKKKKTLKKSTLVYIYIYIKQRPKVDLN
jgi:hypothetical protein